MCSHRCLGSHVRAPHAHAADYDELNSQENNRFERHAATLPPLSLRRLALDLINHC